MVALNKIFDPFNEKKLLDDYIKRLVDKDKEALILLYENTKKEVYGFILSILKNKHNAEDVFQEVYIKVYEKAHLYNSKERPMAWILTIARNLCYDFLKKHKDTDDINDLYDLGSVDKKHKNVEDKMILDIAFNKLTEEERKIVMLYVVSGLRHREIAVLLKLKLSTVLSKYNRAIKRMRDLLKEDIV